MLKPSVGLMLLVSSPFSRFTTVVLPALSRPLRRANPRRESACEGAAAALAHEGAVAEKDAAEAREGADVHHEDAHLPLLCLDTLDDSEQPHSAPAHGRTHSFSLQGAPKRGALAEAYQPHSVASSRGKVKQSVRFERARARARGKKRSTPAHPRPQGRVRARRMSNLDVWVAKASAESCSCEAGR